MNPRPDDKLFQSLIERKEECLTYKILGYSVTLKIKNKRRKNQSFMLF